MKQQGMNIKEEELEFSDPKEEIAYWKQLAEENYLKYDGWIYFWNTR